MTIPDPLNSMVRGFGWTVGRRLAYRLPLWMAVVAILMIFLIRS